MKAPQDERAAIRTPDQRLRVFVSSTLQELAPERQATRSAVERLHLAPVMFELGARPHPPRQLYRAYLQQSDVFVGLYWERYGWVAPGEEVSGLEDEYNLAGALPKLIYIKASAAREGRLQELLDRIQDDDGASYKSFTTARELKRLLESDLATMLAERFDQSHTGPAAVDPPAVGPARPLPAPLTGLIGREEEVRAVEALLTRESVRLVTLIGPGGIGKTRVAIAVGARIGGATGDEVAFVDLSTLTDPAFVPNAIAEALGIRDTGDEPMETKLRSALQQRRILIIVDNFEVVRTAGPTLTALLSVASDLTFLVTSRTRLQVAGEYIVEISPLGLPPPRTSGEDAVAPAALLDFSAVALFVDRARALKPDFELTAENADAVAAICIALDGVPLALELAAARIRTLAPRSMLGRLDRRLPLLAGGASDRPARQQTLRRTIEWSTQQLGDDEVTLLAELGVFSGLFTLDAVEAVAQTSTGTDLLSCLDTLVDSSLVREHDRGGLSYFSMLATVREYALEQLEATDSLQPTRARHARYYVEWGERVERALAGKRSGEWIGRADIERDNVRAAVRFHLDNRDWDSATQLVWSLRIYWWATLLSGEVRGWMEEALVVGGDGLSGRARAIALGCRWAVALMQSSTTDAVPVLTENAELFRAEGDLAGEGLTLNLLATALIVGGSADGTRIDELLTTSLSLLQRAGDSWGQVFALVALGETSLMKHDVGLALKYFAEALGLARVRDDEYLTGYVLLHFAWAQFSAGDIGAATDAFTEGIVLSHKQGSAIGVANALDGLAAVAISHGDQHRAGRLLGSAAKTWKRAGQYNARELSPSRFFLAPMLAGIRMSELEDARAEGAALTPDDAVSFALTNQMPAGG